MKTVQQLVRKMGGCEPAVKKYEKLYGKNSRAFKKAFINSGRCYAEWFGSQLFCFRPLPYVNKRFVPKSSKYPNLPSFRINYYGMYNIVSHIVVDYSLMGSKFKTKKNRIKYWPEVRKRLIELGVKQ